MTRAATSSSSSPLLSICVPTYSRAQFLETLLEQLIPEISNLGKTSGVVELLVSDNGSPDWTPALVRSKEPQAPFLRYQRHPQNIGFTANYRSCVASSRGQYLWVIGDDDLLAPNAVSEVVSTLAEYQPGMTLLLDGVRVLHMDPEPLRIDRPKIEVFPSYAGFVRACTGPLFPLFMAHTWLPAVIYSRAAFSMEDFDLLRRSDFAHVYAFARRASVTGPFLLHSGAMLGMREKRGPHTFRHIPLQQVVLMTLYGLRFRQRELLGTGIGGLPRTLASSALAIARAPFSG